MSNESSGIWSWFPYIFLVQVAFSACHIFGLLASVNIKLSLNLKKGKKGFLAWSPTIFSLLLRGFSFSFLFFILSFYVAVSFYLFNYTSLLVSFTSCSLFPSEPSHPHSLPSPFFSEQVGLPCVFHDPGTKSMLCMALLLPLKPNKVA